MGIRSKASAILLGALLLGGCDRSSGAAGAASSQAFASTQSAKDVVGQLAQATEGSWDLVTDQDGTSLYISPSSFHILNDGKVALAEKLTGKASDPDPATVDIVEFDCPNHSQTLVASFGLTADAKVIGSHSHMLRASETQVTALSPGMVGWTISQSLWVVSLGVV